MADAWQLAKHVMIWGEDVAREPGRLDPTTALLAGIARARRADQTAEVDRLCRHALRGQADPLIVTAFLAPLLLNRASGVDEATALIAALETPSDAERRAYLTSLLAIAASWRGERAESERHAAAALAALEDVEDEDFIGVIEIRLVQAAQVRGDITTVNELSARAAERFERAGAYVWAASTATFRYLPAMELGDVEAVRQMLANAARLADLGNNERIQGVISNIRLGFAATIGDEEMLHPLTAAPRIVHAPYDSFLIALYLALPAAWERRWHDFLAQMRNAEPVTRAQTSLHDAVIALASAATGEDADARSRWRRAVHRLAEAVHWNLSDTRIRRLARALACAAGAAVGDVARAQRAARPLRGTRQLAVFTGDPEPTYAGFQRLVTAMRETRKAATPAVVLSPALLALLAELATDASITEIARRDPQGRSLATIRTHVQRLYDALEVHSRTAAVLKAKELQLR